MLAVRSLLTELSAPEWSRADSSELCGKAAIGFGVMKTSANCFDRIARHAMSLAFIFPATSQATTITFDELSNSTSTTYPSTPLDTTGYRFSTNSTSFLVWADNDGRQANPGFAAVTPSHNQSYVVMEAVDGSSFSFNSIALADVSNGGESYQVKFEFVQAGGGSTTQVVSLDHAVGLQNFSFARTGLTSVKWSPVDNFQYGPQFDNIDVSSAQPVPGPLPVLGAVLAWGWSRKLRSRIRAAESST